MVKHTQKFVGCLGLSVFEHFVMCAFKGLTAQQLTHTQLLVKAVGLLVFIS